MATWDCRIVVTSTQRLRQGPRWHPQSLRPLCQSVGEAPCCAPPRGPWGDRLRASAASPMEWAKHSTQPLAQRTSEGWLASGRGHSPASRALTPAPVCMPPGPESSLPPCQQLGWLETQAPRSGVRTPRVGGRPGRGLSPEQLCDGDKEDGERHEGAHLCPPPPRQPA